MADDPLLIARPAGPRLATRIVFDFPSDVGLDSQLVRTAADVPVLVAATVNAPAGTGASDCATRVVRFFLSQRHTGRAC